jgi:DNA polymerase-3 subunit epsilon
MFQYPSVAGHTHGRAGFAVVDVETSGLDPRSGARILEIAVVRIDPGGRELGLFETLVNPGTVETGAHDVHGITAGMLVDAPPFAQVAPSLLAWLDGVVVVAHNAAFEDAFLTAEFAAAGLSVPDLPALDTLRLAQDLLDLPNHRLSTVCEWAGVRIRDPHTAAGDARATAALLPHLLRRSQVVAWAAPMPGLNGRLVPGYLPRGRLKTSLSR